MRQCKVFVHDVEAEQKTPAREFSKTGVHNERRKSGTSRNRTGDTRIFSPMLYQLS